MKGIVNKGLQEMIEEGHGEGHPLLGGTPLARRAVICCPTSLVGNWEAEARKFLRGRLRVLALCECSRDEAAQSLARFLSPQGEQVLIVIAR